jgi:hypothetical protein
MIKSTLARNTACDAIVHLVDQGTFYPTGRINIYGTDSSVITTLPLSYPAFMDSTDGTAVSNFIYDSTAMIDGTASTFAVMDRDGTAVWSGTVTNTAGIGDMRLNSIHLYKDSTVSISSGTYTVPV